MKKNEKKMLLILILVAIAIIAIVWFITRNMKEEVEKGTQVGKENQVVQEFVQTQEDGTKVNTSSKLKQEKELEGLKITDITLTELEGQLTLLANVTNTTTQDIEPFLVDITFIDKEGNEIDTILGMVSPVKAGETVQLNAGITEDYSNAYDFKIVRK